MCFYLPMFVTVCVFDLCVVFLNVLCTSYEKSIRSVLPIEVLSSVRGGILSRKQRKITSLDAKRKKRKEGEKKKSEGKG